VDQVGEEREEAGSLAALGMEKLKKKSKGKGKCKNV
jgi:hypothetical protein